MEVQLHVDVRMRQKAGTQTTKIKSAKSFVMVHPRKFIPSKYTRYTVVTQDAGGPSFLGVNKGEGSKERVSQKEFTKKFDCA